ncbi:hypothetical protein CC86DRAFT_402192 [Ophiobolus disseminans]|uniref:MYND-type domain-containing protein n=1 Tax=Ophiobolus disseminans TaxID=1469910 RepID=A0A6A7AEU9_9PLEO|nr:hypothetical protein CC86DRAFT_402192 [Ophiobolus disseminans]
MASPTASTQPLQLCALCVNPATSMCQSCRNIHYCSADCRKIEWPTHKLICKQLKSFGNSPSPDCLRIVDRQVTGEPGLKLKVDVSNLNIPAQHKATLREWEVLKDSCLLRRPNPHMTWIGCYVDIGGNTLLTGNNNASLAAIDKELPRYLSGPIIFYALGRNLDSTDFRNVVDHLRWED